MNKTEKEMLIEKINSKRVTKAHFENNVLIVVSTSECVTPFWIASEIGHYYRIHFNKEIKLKWDRNRAEIHYRNGRIACIIIQKEDDKK